MIRDWSDLRIFVRPGWTDMRKQVDGLAALVRDGLGRDPWTGVCTCSAGWAGGGSRPCIGTGTDSAFG
jgi:hypothetical protein